MAGNEQGQKVLCTAFLLGLLAWILTWLTRPEADLFLAVASPVAILLLSGALFLILRRPAHALPIARVTYWFFLVIWLGLISLGNLNATTVLTLVMLLVFAYLVFSTGTAFRVALVSVVAEVGIGFAHIYLGPGAGSPLPELVTLGKNGLFLGVILLLLHALAKNKDAYAAEQLESQRLRVAAYRDVLTGLRNRRRLEEQLDQQLALAQRHDRPLSLILFDIDRFKDINDTLGHEVGDETLKLIAAAIEPALRAGDVLGRWGGEEFLIITPETDAEEARALAERLREQIERHDFPHPMKVTASFGVAEKGEGSTPKEMLRSADTALYEAKGAGRNRTAQAEPF